MWRPPDLTGRRFGKLTVIEAQGAPTNPDGQWWLCECDCGISTVARTKTLNQGTTRSCGCLRHKGGPRGLRVAVGDTFGFLTVDRLGLPRHGYKRWVCLCACGAETTVRSALLKNGQTRSCGCLRSFIGRDDAPIVVFGGDDNG